MRKVFFTIMVCALAISPLLRSAAAEDKELKIISEAELEKTEDGSSFTRKAAGVSASDSEMWTSDAQGNIKRTGSGTADYDVTKQVTTKVGEVYTVDKSGTIKKTPGGMEIEGTADYTGPKGKKATAVHQGSVQKTAGGYKYSAERQITGEKGLVRDVQVKGEAAHVAKGEWKVRKNKTVKQKKAPRVRKTRAR